MLATTIRTPPSVGDFTPLAEYQSQTPESFVEGKPILHLHIQDAKALIRKSQCGSLAVFPADSSKTSNGESVDGDSEELVEQKVDVFVGSDNFTIFSNQVEAGVSIPYPAISIHAVKQTTTDSQGGLAQSVWMQLDFSDGGAGDDDFDTVELTIIPPTSTDVTSNPASQLYDAMAKCSDLHPDPNDGEDDEDDEYDRIVFEGNVGREALEGFTGVMRGAADGGLPPPMPGSGGWITADNVHEFFDEEGNWIRGQEEEEEEELGEGAGRVRAREEVEGQGANGDGSNDDPENKRPRVD